jgi:hypothetical protein
MSSKVQIAYVIIHIEEAEPLLRRFRNPQFAIRISHARADLGMAPIMGMAPNAVNYCSRNRL